jgi:hypothetical protein
MRIQFITTSLLVSICLLNLNGCTKKPAPVEEVGEHVHEDAGPHGGHVIEIGAKSHHAELVHDEATNRVGIYVLDGEALKSTPIETTTVMVNVAEDGAPSQYELAAMPQSGEADGTSSYFEIVSEPLSKIVSGESAAKSVQARVSIQIGERPYVGMIDTMPHDHDHAHEGEHGEEHAGEDADAPVVEPGAEPTAEPGAAPAVEPATEPAAEPSAEPAAEPSEEPAADPAAEPGAEPATEPAVEPEGEPAAEPAAEPSAEPATEPAAEPAAE